jgi:hypothetical protein
MQLHHFPSSHPVRPTASVQLASYLHSLALTGGFVLRFVALSALACLFVSAPISPREVPHANHRPASGL